MKLLRSKHFFLQLIFLSLVISFCCCNKPEDSETGEKETVIETEPSNGTDNKPNPEPEPEPEKVLPSLGDVTKQVVLLGNPLNAKYPDGTQKVYARNIWDMHAFNNKIYFGGGNSSNYGPAINAGPADLWTFNPSSQTFTKEFTVDDEQIHRIREFDNELYIPGHDARESWDYGNFYRLETAGWKKYRTIPDAVHVYDIYKWGNKLFAAIGAGSSATTTIQISEDNGKTWRNIFCSYNNEAPKICNCFGRSYTLLSLNNQLYATYYFLPLIYTGNDHIFNQITTAEGKALYNGEAGDRIERPIVFGDQTVYIVGVTDNDHQYLPLALRHAKNAQQVARFDLPENVLPRDILVQGKWLIILISTKIDNTTYRNTVLLTSDISTETIEWKEAFNFTATTFARSFEYLNGVFYFGLGCETDVLAPATGNILSFAYSL